MFERLLIRLSVSEYKDKFVLKGGMLVASIVGLDNRATMDLDTTLKNLPLTPKAIRNALERVCAIPVDDNVIFEHCSQKHYKLPQSIVELISRLRILPISYITLKTAES